MDGKTGSGRIAPLLQRLLHYPRSLAALCGILTATGLPPLHLWPLALVSLAGLIWLLHHAQGWKRAFQLGWMFGLGYFTFGNSWIATAFTYQNEMPAFLGWVAVPLLSLYLALYPALAAALAQIFSRRFARNSLVMLITGLALAGFWIIAEWLRGTLFTGFAWGPLGLIALGDWSRPGMAAALPWLGTYALSGMIIVIAAIILHTGLMQNRARRWLLSCGLLIALSAAMYWPPPKSETGILHYTLVQPDIRQENLNDPALFEEQFQRSARLSRRKAPGRRLVLWPESGIPDYLRDGYPYRYYLQMTAGADPAFARERIGRVIGPGSLLLTGAQDLVIENDRARAAYNSVTVLNANGMITGGYRKAHLVPFGEYLPLRALLEPLGLTRFVAGTIDFEPGPGPRTLDLGPWGNAGIQICYEIVFPGSVVDRNNRPDYIFNPSNDGWFGTFGPPQHLGQARMRAIEEGLPVLRSTTTGISAVIDASGIVRDRINMRVAGRMDGVIPPAKDPTPFARMGNMLSLLWASGLLLAAALVARKKHR
ncbi:MAG: apolipoprotein N-acyltransferase [Sphingomonadaceae bacterium]